jgi:hypothetical protein
MLVALFSMIASAQTKLEGVIKGRSGSQVILQTADSPKVIVLLSTDVAQVQGALKARKKRMSMAALVPGLPIKVEGAYDAENQLVAKTVRFKGNRFGTSTGHPSGFGRDAATSPQKLSEDRANNVANILLQQGHVPLTNMLAPGAMGESRQIGKDTTAESEAGNRRVVVRVRQNKGIAGL